MSWHGINMSYEKISRTVSNKVANYEHLCCIDENGMMNNSKSRYLIVTVLLV